jgi:hypothetical protein
VSTLSHSPRRSRSVLTFPCTFGGRPHRIPISSSLFCSQSPWLAPYELAAAPSRRNRALPGDAVTAWWCATSSRALNTVSRHELTSEMTATREARSANRRCPLAAGRNPVTCARLYRW